MKISQEQFDYVYEEYAKELWNGKINVDTKKVSTFFKPQKILRWIIFWGYKTTCYAGGSKKLTALQHNKKPPWYNKF